MSNVWIKWSTLTNVTLIEGCVILLNRSNTKGIVNRIIMTKNWYCTIIESDLQDDWIKENWPDPSQTESWHKLLTDVFCAGVFLYYLLKSGQGWRQIFVINTYKTWCNSLVHPLNYRNCPNNLGPAVSGQCLTYSTQPQLLNWSSFYWNVSNLTSRILILNYDFLINFDNFVRSKTISSDETDSAVFLAVNVLPIKWYLKV